MSIDKLSSNSEYLKYSLDQSTIKDSDDTTLSLNSNNNITNPLEVDTVSFSSNSATNADVATRLKAELNKTKEKQGLIGKAWDGIKNIFGMKAGSNNVEKTIEKLENGEISQEKAQEVLTKYQDGQKMCVDIVGDMLSGIVAVGCAAAAPFTGGASLLVAAGAGAAVKVAIKGVDCAVGGRDYKLKDFGYDLITGSINGAMAPITNALGGVVGTGIAKACGLNAGKVIVKETGEKVIEESVKQTGKSFLSNLLAKQGTEYIVKEGTKTGIKTTLATVAAYGADMAVDGALGGATDGFARSLADGDFENMGQNMADGFAGGLVAAPIIGGGFRLAGRAGSKVGDKLFGRTTANAVADNTDSIVNGMAGASIASGLTIATRELSENVADGLSESATREISDGIADPTSDVVIKEASENLADGITDVDIKEVSKNAADELSTTVLPKQNSGFQVENNGTHITKIEYVSKNGEQKVIDGLKISNTYKFGDAELEIFTDFVENGVDSKNAMYATRLLSFNSFETQQETDLFIKCVKKGYNAASARNIANDYCATEQVQLLNSCIDLGLEGNEIYDVIIEGTEIEKYRLLQKMRKTLNAQPTHIDNLFQKYSIEQCDSYQLLVENGVFPEHAYEKIITGGFGYKSSIDFKKLIEQKVNSELAFTASTKNMSDSQYELFLSMIKKGVDPDIACIASSNNFPKETIDILVNKNDFEFKLNKLQNEAGYKITSQKINGDVVENIEILENGKSSKFTSKRVADGIYKESVSGSNRSVEVNKLDFSQIETVYDKSGNSLYVLHTKRSDDLAGGYDIVRYDCSNYPKDFDFESAIRNGKMTDGQILAGAKRLEDGSIEYFENLEYQGNKTTRRYTQSVDGDNITSTKYSYNIVDEDGKTILNLDRSWSQNNDGSTTTVINGKTFTATFDDSSKSIIVTDCQGNTTFIDIPAKLKGVDDFSLKYYGSQEASYNEFYQLCKNMPADMLLELNYYNKNIKLVSKCDSSYSRNLLEISATNSQDNFGVVAHELGHAIDDLKCISEDDILIKIYNDEISNFEATYPKSMQENIKYFDQKGGSSGTGLAELVAETNMLYKSYNRTSSDTIRAQYLVQYFPRTLAYILNVLNE